MLNIMPLEKNKMRHHFTNTRMAIIKKFSQGWEEIGTFSYIAGGSVK